MGMGTPVKQLGLFVLAELSYEAVRGLADGARDQAIVNGQNVISLEKSLHTFFEPNLQAIFIDHRWIIDFANYMYMNSHFVVTTAFLVWLYLFRNQNFYFVRNMFMVAMALAIVGYALRAHRAAAALPAGGLRRHDHGLRAGQPRLRPGQALHQPLRRDPQHARRLLDDDRRHRCPGLAAHDHQDPLGRLPGARLLGGRRDRQPLLDRRCCRPARRRSLAALAAREVLARARPAVWSFRPATT